MPLGPQLPSPLPNNHTTATDGGLGEPPGRGGSTLDKRLLLSLLASAAHLNAG